MKVTIEIDEYEFAQIVSDVNSAVEDVKEVQEDIENVVDSTYTVKLRKLDDKYSYLKKILESVQKAIKET